MTNNILKVGVPDAAVPDAPFDRTLYGRVGYPLSAPEEHSGRLQPFSHGFLLISPGCTGTLCLHVDGRLARGTAALDLAPLGSPLAGATELPVRSQQCRDGTILWTAMTGPLLLLAGTWQVPLGRM